jgi:hypothetical protein
VKVLGHEVADADGADLAVGEELLERPVGVEGAVGGRGQRVMQEQQVDLVDAQLAGALVESAQRSVVAVVGDPELRLDEDLISSHVRTA